MSATRAIPPSLEPAGRYVRFGRFRFDRVDRLLFADGGELDLPPRAVFVLEHLIGKAGRVVSKQALMEAVWPDSYVSETSLTEAVSLVRQALGDDAQRPEFIQTVHRRGYRFVASVQVESASPETSPIIRLVEPMGPGAGLPAGRPGRVRTASLAALVAVTAAGLGAWRVGVGGRPAQTSRPDVVRFGFDLPLEPAPELKMPAMLALAPDGGELVFAGSRSGRGQLHRRAMDQLAPAPITGTEGASGPFFSPDGRFVGFFADGKLKKLRLGGPGPVSLCDTPPALGASWGDDGQIVFAAGRNHGLQRVPAAGGEPAVLTTPDAGRGELGHYWPEVLPGSEVVVFTVWTAGGLPDARIAARSLRTGEQKTLLRGASFARYAPGGQLVFAREGSLAAAAFDPDSLELAGPPVAVLDGVYVDWFTGAAQFGLSRGGDIAYLPGSHRVPLHNLAALSPGGAPRRLPAPERPFMNLALDPGGRRLAVTIHEGSGSDIWVTDLERGALERLTFEAHNIEPTWTADGARVTFASSRTGPYNIFSVAADGSGAPVRLLGSTLNQYPTSWSPDGRWLAYTELHPVTGADLWALSADGEPHPLLRTQFDEDFAAFSPDGRWLAYQSNESGDWQVSIRPFPSLEPRLQVSTAGGRQPRWSPDGARLLYDHADRIWAADIRTGAELQTGAPRALLDATFLVAHRPFGEGVVGVVTDDRLTERVPAVVVIGWASEVGRLLSASPRRR